MRQSNYIIEREKGKHLKLGARKIIAHLYNKQNKNYSEIAREMNCHRTTISREIKKGLTTFKNADWSDREVYVPEIAQGVYDE
ncbi:helix-turn-helix domain-containing protein, partial [Selenihalanaerobacter shriftii]